MQKEYDEQNKHQEHEEQRQGTEAESAQATSQRAQMLAESVAAYRKALRSDLRIARLHMPEMTHPLEVKDSYIPLHLHQKTGPGYDLDWGLQEMRPHHAMLRADRRQLARWASYPLAPEQALRMYKHCIIMGDPGSGKTTLLKYLTLQAIDQQLKGLPDLPIHIELPAFARSGHRDLLAYASAVWQERYGFSQADALDYIQKKLQEGDALLLLDALDETGAGSTNESAENASFQISKAVADVAARFQHAPIVVTARKAGYHLRTRLDGFAELEVRDVRPEESKQFVERWFASHRDPSERGNAPEFLAKLEHTPRMQAAAHPLLLSLMLIVYEDRRDLPKRRAQLYDQYVDTQLTTWDASRTIRRMQAFKPEHHRQLLEEVAWHSHRQGQCAFHEGALLEVIAAFLPTVGLPPEQNGRVLEEIATENGLLQEQARGWYGFVHLTLQEYFVAHYAARHQELDTLVQKREDPWWEEALLFYAGCIADVSLLVQQFLGLTNTHPLQDDLFHTNLILAGHCLAAAHPPVRHIPLSEEVVTRLFQLLKTSRYASTQAQVAETLAEIGDPTIHAQLVQLLSDEQLDWSVRQRIAEALERLGERSIAPQLVQLLSDKQLDSQVRQSIIHVLGQLAERSSCSRLVQLLFDERMEPRLRQHIAEAFGQFKERSVATQLVQLLSDTQLDWGLRESIAYALVQLGEHSIAPQLLQLLSDEQVEYALRQHIAYALGQLGERSVAPQLVELLSDEQLNTYVRQSSAEALGQLGERSVAPQLVELLSDRRLNPRVRGSTAVGLAQLEERSIAPQLLQLLTDRKLDQSVRQGVAEALGRSGERSMVPQLVQLVSDRQLDQWVRANIAHALGQIGGRSVAAQLVQLLSDQGLASQVRESIAYTLGQLGERSIASQLVQLLSDEQADWSVRKSIPHVLGQLGERSIMPQLLQLLSDEQEDWSMRLQIAEALGQLGERFMIPQLVQLLSDEQLRWPMRQGITHALGHLDEHAIASQLLELLSEEQLGWPVRQRIAYALGQLGERSVVPKLVHLLVGEQMDTRVRESIAYALGQLGERSVAPQLVQLLSDKQLDWQLHERIAGALGRIGEPSIVPQVVQLLSDEQLNSSVRQCIAEEIKTLAIDEATIHALAALLSTSDIADSIHHLLWTMSRQIGVRIFVAGGPNGNNDQIAFRIEHI